MRNNASLAVTIELPATEINQEKIKAKKVIVPEPPWNVTPNLDSSKLLQHYLMLSKIRLTCELKILHNLFQVIWV